MAPSYSKLDPQSLRYELCERMEAVWNPSVKIGFQGAWKTDNDDLARDQYVTYNTKLDPESADTSKANLVSKAVKMLPEQPTETDYLRLSKDLAVLLPQLGLSLTESGDQDKIKHVILRLLQGPVKTRFLANWEEHEKMQSNNGSSAARKKMVKKKMRASYALNELAKNTFKD